MIRLYQVNKISQCYDQRPEANVYQDMHITKYWLKCYQLHCSDSFLVPAPRYLCYKYQIVITFHHNKPTLDPQESRRKMATSISIIMLATLLTIAPLCFSRKTNTAYLYSQFYDLSCPNAIEIVKSIVSSAVAKETCMAVSLLRLHFHDCFVKVSQLILIYFFS